MGPWAEIAWKCTRGATFILIQEVKESVQSEQQQWPRHGGTVETLPDDSNQAEPNNRIQKDGDEQRDKDPRAREDVHAFNDLIRVCQGKVKKYQAYIESLNVPTLEAYSAYLESLKVSTPEACHQHTISYEEYTNRLRRNKHSGSYRQMSPLAKEVKLEGNRKNECSISLFWCGFCRCNVLFVGVTSDRQHIRSYHFGEHLLKSE